MVVLRVNRPLPICPKPLFQSEATCKAIDIKMTFLILMRINFIFKRKVLHFESERFCNSEKA